jgi:hypothetical protein
VSTNEGRYSIVQAVQIDNTTIRLRYRTWEKRLESLQIVGDFQCDGIVGVDPTDVVFTPSPMLGSGIAVEKVRIADRRIGRWAGTVVHHAPPVGRFDAVTQGISPDAPVTWAIDGNGLTEGTHDVTVPGGVVVHYELAGRHLVLSPKTAKPLELLLEATVVDKDANAFTTRRCVHFDPVCRSTGVRYIPAFSEYLDTYLSHFGVVEVPVPARPVPPPAPHDPPPILR